MEKANLIFGVSSKFDFGKWDHEVYIFGDQKEAEEWLNTEEYDFRERELMSESDAANLVGQECIEECLKTWREEHA